MVAGLNYDVHKNEVGGGNFVLFPKPIEPTGPYGDLKEKASICLLDYEAEIAFVTLDEINFKDDLPSGENGSWSKFAEKGAFFAVNDVTDRESQILDPDRASPRPRLGRAICRAAPGSWRARSLSKARATERLISSCRSIATFVRTPQPRI